MKSPLSNFNDLFPDVGESGVKSNTGQLKQSRICGVYSSDVY